MLLILAILPRPGRAYIPGTIFPQDAVLLSKEVCIMLKIKSEGKVVDFARFDYELEDGTLLHETEWNGEEYTVKNDGCETYYKPVEKATQFDEDNEPCEWEVIGFEESK